jgi:hypothetical protein
MTSVERVEEIAERLRREPYHLLKNDCIIKSQRLKRECQRLGVPARVVVCIGLAPARVFGRWVTMPVVHAWTEVAGKRVEISRPIGSAGVWGIVPVNIRPVIAIRI